MNKLISFFRSLFKSDKLVEKIKVIQCPDQTPGESSVSNLIPVDKFLLILTYLIKYKSLYAGSVIKKFFIDNQANLEFYITDSSMDTLAKIIYTQDHLNGLCGDPQIESFAKKFIRYKIDCDAPEFKELMRKISR